MLAPQESAGLLQQILAHVVDQDHALDAGDTAHDLFLNESLGGEGGGGASGALAFHFETENTVFDFDDFHIAAVTAQKGADVLVQDGFQIFVHSGASFERVSGGGGAASGYGDVRVVALAGGITP
jgi:hypothetical protein